MRFADLIGLSLGALWQQKARTVMATLGVVFGAFVLVMSLSLGQGTQETIEREKHLNADLRTVNVYSRAADQTSAVPAERLQVKGEMSEEKRKRLRETLLYQQLNSMPFQPRAPLDRERLQVFAKTEHVEAVTPLVQLSCWALLDAHSYHVQAGSTGVDNRFCRRRLVAGDFFHEPHEQSVVVSEFLCYQLGLTTDDDIAGLIGKKLRLEFRFEPPTAGLQVYLSKGDGSAASREEQVALEKVQAQLPSAVEGLDLTPAEKSALRAAASGTPARPSTPVVEELTVVGVLRQANDDDRSLSWSRLNTEADVILPPLTAADVFFKRPGMERHGVDYVSLTVDREENVRGMVQLVSDMGFTAHAPLEFIDKDRLIYLLISCMMTCVAGVALLIAALGIANTMLMSVLERTREIGIFKAIGAGDGHVQLIFLIEGACIGLVGGALGLLLAWAASFPTDSWIRSLVSKELKIDLKESLFVFPLWLTVGVVLFAALVTTLAAFYPARRAARVEPLKALRHE